MNPASSALRTRVLIHLLLVLSGHWKQSSRLCRSIRHTSTIFSATFTVTNSLAEYELSVRGNPISRMPALRLGLSVAL